MVEEISLVAPGQFKSKHDDFLDTISMLASLKPWKPSIESVKLSEDGSELWEDDIEEKYANIYSYIV